MKRTVKISQQVPAGAAEGLSVGVDSELPDQKGQNIRPDKKGFIDSLYKALHLIRCPGNCVN